MIKEYLYLLIIFVGIDGIWLSITSKNLYGKYLSHLMAPTPNLIPAIFFYLLYPLAIYLLVFYKSDNTLLTMLVKALTLGVAAYGTYNLTNASVMNNWPMFLVFIDIAWGGIVTVLTVYIYHLLNK